MFRIRPQPLSLPFPALPLPPPSPLSPITLISRLARLPAGSSMSCHMREQNLIFQSLSHLSVTFLLSGRAPGSVSAALQTFRGTVWSLFSLQSTWLITGTQFF